MGQQATRNPLIQEDPADTIAECCEYVEYMQLNSEDLHRGHQLSLGVLREALESLKEAAGVGV